MKPAITSCLNGLASSSKNGVAPYSLHERNGLSGHALRNANLRQRALMRAETAPALARAVVKIRAEVLAMTRLEFSRRSGISRGTLRDLELGIHTPMRRILQRFLAFCQRCHVGDEALEELRRLYAGTGHNLAEFIGRLELKAGSPSELARRVGISAVTLWEYRRGNFPLPLKLLHRLCDAVKEDFKLAEVLWYQAERQRLLDRGYPEALAEFWVRCASMGYTEKDLLKLGMNTATVRRLRYLELPSWQKIAKSIKSLCRSDSNVQVLKKLWLQNEETQRRKTQGGFGSRIKLLRTSQGIGRRELADLFRIGGKKPARIIKYIEEDGFYSAQAYPAGLAAILAGGKDDEGRLLEEWQKRRRQFHRRRRPEMQIAWRLARELYGFSIGDMELILGYASLEYQRLERGVIQLAESAQDRIVEAIHQAGRRKIEALLRHRQACERRRFEWRTPASVSGIISLLAKREGGLIPLSRFLKQAGLKGLWAGRLRTIIRGEEVPPWYLLELIAKICGILDTSQVREDWATGYRIVLQKECNSPLSVELRMLIAESAPTLRAFSNRLQFNYSVLVRDLQRIDREEPGKWFHIERILRAAGVPEDDERWKEAHALWYTAEARKKKPPQFSRRRPILDAK